jgi:hypothetical protein
LCLYKFVLITASMFPMRAAALRFVAAAAEFMISCVVGSAATKAHESTVLWGAIATAVCSLSAVEKKKYCLSVLRGLGNWLRIFAPPVQYVQYSTVLSP